MIARTKLTLAALCALLPLAARAQTAPPAPQAPEAAPAATPAPVIKLTPYGFVLLTYHQNSGKFTLTDFPAQVLNEDDKSSMFAARQSRIGFNAAYADGSLGDVKLAGRIEFDFFGPNATSWDSAPLRLRYAFATASWDLAAAGKLTLLAGQTDGLVNPLHPELIAQIATPTFMFAGNYFRRSPQLRATYDRRAGMVALRAEIAALSPTDATGVSLSAGNQSGQPDLEARIQASVAPRKDVAATLGVSGHYNVRHYPTVTGDAGTPVFAIAESDVTATAFGLDMDVRFPYGGLRGEYFSAKGTDDTYFGIGPGVATIRQDADPLTPDEVTAVESDGWWVQLIGKPCPRTTLVAGYGHTKVDPSTLAAATSTSKERLENDMIHAGIAYGATRVWKLGAEWTRTTSRTRSGLSDFEGTGWSLTLSSRFSF